MTTGPRSIAGQAPRRSLWAWLAPIALALAAGVVYSNSFSAPFVFDGVDSVRNNESLSGLWPWTYASARNRPLGFFTFALNRLAHGTDVWGYHAVNLAIHVAAGLALFGIVRRTLARPPLAARYATAADFLAFAIALVWLLHPLQTQSVTYLYQRLESLLGLFYLLTLYGFVRAQQSPRARLWYAFSIVCCALGMGTKEVMITAPLAVVWYDRALVASSWRELWQRRRGYYVGLAATWGWLAFLMIANWDDYPASGVLVVSSDTPLSYALSQPAVVLHYVRLAIWPQGLCLDYGWPAMLGVAEVMLPTALVLSLVGLVVWSLWRNPPLGFVGGCFFLVLAPTSSFAPLADRAFEHRMYLPLASLVTLAVIGGFELVRRLVQPERQTAALWLLLGCAALPLGIATFQRNRDYRDEYSIWTDVVRKVPANPKGHIEVGRLLASGQVPGGKRDLAQAESQLTLAILLDPRQSLAYVHRGTVHAARGDVPAALDDYKRALELNARSATAFNNRAMLLAETPDARWRNPRQAIDDAQRACELTGWRRYEMLDTLAAAYAAAGDFRQAAIYQEAAIRRGAHNARFLRGAKPRLERYRESKPRPAATRGPVP